MFIENLKEKYIYISPYDIKNIRWTLKQKERGFIELFIVNNNEIKEKISIIKDNKKLYYVKNNKKEYITYKKLETILRKEAHYLEKLYI